jgi:hypothetical protein
MPNGRDTAHPRKGEPAAPRTRRLEDRILVPFHQACDNADLEVAEALLRVVERILARPTGAAPGADQRRNRENLVAAHERLWQLRHPPVRDQ